MPPFEPAGAQSPPLDLADDGRVALALVGDITRELDRLYDFTPGSVPKAAIINGLGRLAETCSLLDVMRGTMFRHKALADETTDGQLLFQAIRRLGVPHLSHVNVFPDDLPQPTRDMLNGVLTVVGAAGAMADLMVRAFRSGELDNSELREQTQTLLYGLGPIFRAFGTSFNDELRAVSDRIMETEFGGIDEQLAIASGSTVPPVPDNNP